MLKPINGENVNDIALKQIRKACQYASHNCGQLSHGAIKAISTELEKTDGQFKEILVMHGRISRI